MVMCDNPEAFITERLSASEVISQVRFSPIRDKAMIERFHFLILSFPNENDMVQSG